MRPEPYIGITGYTRRDQIKKSLELFPLHSPYRLMAGVLVSDKSLAGGEANYKRYPRAGELGSIYIGDPRALNLLHLNIHEPEQLFDLMVRAQGLAGPHCHGFQLNMAWPKVELLKQYRATFSKKVIVLQCGARALKEVDNSPAKLVERVKSYGDLIDYVLIDQSAGEGIDLDLGFMRECLVELYKLQRLGLGGAGGIRPHNVFRLQGLRREFGLSIDTESGVRVSDEMQLSLVENYLKSSTEPAGDHTLQSAPS